KFYYVDYWFRQDHVGGRVHMFVGPNISKEVSIILDRANIPYNVTTKNWFPSSEKKRSRRTKSGEIDLYDFNSYDDIIEHLYKLEDRYKEFIKMKEIGKSYEGRSMYSFTIGYPSDHRKPVIFIENNIHAREWVTLTSLLLFIDDIIKNQQNYYDILKGMDLIIVPSINPDGYEYTRNTDRGWRGNRNVTGNQRCGVDLNRNFPYGWKKNDWRCMTHSGGAPASEPETKVLIKHIEENLEYIKGYVSVHSFGRLLLIPWGYQNDYYLEKHEELCDITTNMYNEILEKTGVSYTIGTTPGILYDVNGISTDYIASKGIEFTFTIELAPSSEEDYIAFYINKDMIPSSAKEFIVGINSFINQL
uniref:Peptidase_M14 domain-containing protein n=1 Tax=Parastrongyloides trichosuri TaxID=131310 RepID=A0A0N4ZJU0_PARTI